MRLKEYRRNFKFLLLCMVFIHVTGRNFAQNTEIRPSVNAQQFITAASGANSLHTGQLSVNIPLFTLEGRGLTLPISVSFNGGSISNESDASNIGLGWSLLAGGVITQTIKDKNDNSISSINNIPWRYNYDFIQNKLEEEENDIYANNKFDMAMDQAIGSD